MEGVSVCVTEGGELRGGGLDDELHSQCGETENKFK